MFKKNVKSKIHLDTSYIESKITKKIFFWKWMNWPHLRNKLQETIIGICFINNKLQRVSFTKVKK